jgi:hypothetical protein
MIYLFSNHFNKMCIFDILSMKSNYRFIPPLHISNEETVICIAFKGKKLESTCIITQMPVRCRYFQG